MFPIGVKWEDVQPHFYLLHNAQICIALKETGFIYRINSGGQTTSGRGISRLDTITVFRDTIHMAIDDHWPREEIAYILRTMFIFVQWCIRVTNTEYIVPLLKGFHELFCDVPNTYFKMYFKLCSPHRKKEILLKKILRSPFYLILQDYQIRAIGKKHMECIKNILNKFRRK